MKIKAALETWRNRLSLRQQIACVTALLCIILVLSCAGVAAEIARQQAVARVETAIVGTANSMTGRLETYMDERFRDIRDLASLKALGATWGADPSKVRETLDHLQSSVPDFAWLGFTGTTGTVIAGSQGMLEGAQVSGTSWFRAGLTGMSVQDVRDATMLADILGPTPSGEPHRFVDIAVPVKGTTGATEGVLAAHLDWHWATRIRDYVLSLTSSSRQNSIWILRADGQTLLGPEFGSTSFPASVIAQARAGERTVFVDPNEQGTLTAIVGPEGGILSDLGWLVVVRRPMDLAMADARQISLTILVVGLVLSLLGTLAAWFVAGRLTRPLAELTGQVDSVGREPSVTTISRRGGSSDVRRLSSAVRSLLLRVGTAEDAKLVAERATQTMQVRLDERTRALGAHINTLQEQADTDPLTHLLNRRAFLVFASDAMNYFRRYGRDICILVIDIDMFKRVNDTFGHGVGDDVIEHVGRCIQGEVRTTDKVARFGGEEFVVLLRETDLGNAFLLAERIRHQIGSGVVEARGQTIVNVTASIGLALAHGDDRDIADVIERADRALYLAKTSGRNRVVTEVRGPVSDAA
jgi:diguanylate cyclase (GGDEF)-like protein